MTKTIQLTQGQVALVDDWRYEELSQWNWQAHWNKGTRSFYAERTEGKRPFRKSIQMHRQIMNTPKTMQCDHIDHNTLDNQEHNLRNATYSQNQMNSHIRVDNKLNERCINVRPNGYLVQIKAGGKYVFTKIYGTLDEAIAARDAAIQEFHGDFAYRGES
jgi:hypothetical protein